MKIRPRTVALAALGVLLAGAALGVAFRGAGPADAAAQQPAATNVPADDFRAIRQAANDFVRALEKGDAKAVAAFWAPEGEYVAPDGEVLRGRGAIERAYAEFFKKNPGLKIDVKVESLRLFGPGVAVEEGTLTLTRPDQDAEVSRYMALHVRQDGRWLAAQVREWPASPAPVRLQDVGWLVGEWVAQTERGEVRTTYAWDEHRAFLHGRYAVRDKDRRTLDAGMEIIGRDPSSGGLRSWVFESGGGFGESRWRKDGKRWVLQASGVLPDGNEVAVTNTITPLDNDSFLWHSVGRSAGGKELKDTAPIKVTRVKAGG